MGCEEAMLVSVFVAVTFAPTTAAQLVSFTVPEMLAVTPANARPAKSSATASSAMALSRRETLKLASNCKYSLPNQREVIFFPPLPNQSEFPHPTVEPFPAEWTTSGMTAPPLVSCLLVRNVVVLLHPSEFPPDIPAKRF